MISIINSNFTRIRKSKVFWIGAAFVLLIACYDIFSSYREYIDVLEIVKQTPEISEDTRIINNYLEWFYWFTGFVVAALMIVCPILIGADNENGTIRNMIVSGKSRTSIFFANIITAICIALVYIIVWSVPVVTVGLNLFDRVNTWDNIFSEMLVGVVVVLVFTIIYSSITMILKSNKTATIICIVISALLAISAILLEYPFAQANEVKDLIENGEERYDTFVSEAETNIELSEKKINSNLLNDSQKKSEERNIKSYKDTMKGINTYDDYLRRYGSMYNIDKVKNKKNMKMWVTLFHMNLVNQGIYYIELKDDSYVYTMDGTRHDNTDTDKKDINEPHKEESTVTPEYMASCDAEQYDTTILTERLPNDTPDNDKNITMEEKNKEKEKVEKEYLEIEKKLFEDEAYKKAVEKKVDTVKRINKLQEERDPYKRFDLGDALIFDTICSLIFILGAYAIFLKKDID